MRRIALGLALVASSACSTLGSSPSSPEGLPHGGTGPFRLAQAEEVDVPPTPPGSTLFERTRAVENGMTAEGFLFYAGAEPREIEMPDAGPIDDGGTIDDAGVLEDAGTADAGPPPPEGPLEIDWSVFEPRVIVRSAPRAEGLGFDAGSEVLAATDAWEGGFVRDPWAVVLEDGRARLYYGAEGGIGVAQAASIDGTFAKVGSAPVIAGEVRRPTVIDTRGTEAEHAFLMYFERDGSLVGASSDDGLAWAEIGVIDLPALAARDMRDSDEIEVGGPGVIAARTEAGRAVIRLYYESRRANGQVLITMAGSFDGVTFEPLRIPVVQDRALRWPAPRQLDLRVTMLYMQGERGGRGAERGALLVGIAPGGVTLP
ncbi:hypothetical protein [Sandaracinus amylolyticus]|uniref:hypothetical protein n=1 Tax=Sandaracinus amylolyticus TaxID=927083 RepID=UPI001F29B239|nr:hypothetical protein [Sandaracinus amylolyticus]UJR79753.1 Hypothetical protein I5071_17910 [Sandaracinus amylolyticus]